MGTAGTTTPPPQAEAQAKSSLVDETPISPIRDSGRRGSLEDHLKKRPDRAELAQRNIIPAFFTPDDAQKSSLEDHLKHRPDRAELVERNILPESIAAPALAAHQKELAKHMRADSLNEKISHRPTPEKLLETGVLHEDPRSAEEKYEEAIELEYAKREGGA